MAKATTTEAKHYDLIGSQSYVVYQGAQRRLMQAKGEVREENGMGIMRVDEATAKAVLAFHGPKVFLNEIPA